MKFTNKDILIVSQQDWGEMFISKHHYALELSKLGNKVFFLNGPDQEKRLKPGEIIIEPTKYPDLFVVKHRFFFPYFFRFKIKFFFRWLVSIHIRRIIKKINSKIDIVWSFDLSNAIPLVAFPENNIKIFMPVDEPHGSYALSAAANADVIVSVTNEILEKYKNYNAPKLFLNHGVSEIFINNKISEHINTPIRVGLSGNFLRPDIDRDVLIKIIESNPDIIFDFWGSVNYNNANITAPKDDESIIFSNRLCGLSNVVAHGPVSPLILSEKLKEVDCFLICYDIEKDQSKGTNYHKILEYIATGKVIISNNVTTYQNYPELITMCKSRLNNDELPALFKNVVKNIKEHNTLAKQIYRIDFAKQYLYPRQLEKIETFLNNSLPGKLN